MHEWLEALLESYLAYSLTIPYEADSECCHDIICHRRKRVEAENLEYHLCYTESR